MEYDTFLAATYAAGKLDSLLARSHRDTMNLIEKADIPPLVKHFATLRAEYRMLKEKLDAVEQEVNDLSYNIIPEIFANQHVKTINLDDLGRVTVNVRWNASMTDKTRGMDWLRSTGNEGLIIETVNAQTLGAFAKVETLAGRPLPDDTFNVGTSNYTSITKV